MLVVKGFPIPIALATSVGTAAKGTLGRVSVDCWSWGGMGVWTKGWPLLPPPRLSEP